MKNGINLIEGNKYWIEYNDPETDPELNGSYIGEGTLEEIMDNGDLYFRVIINDFLSDIICLWEEDIKKEL